MSPPDKIGKVSSASVLKGTGKNWDQWVNLLKKKGASTWTHKELVSYLKTKHKLSLWWQQGVAIGFELYIGKRIEGRNNKGEYSLVVTRTLPLSDKELWKLLSSQVGLSIWLKAMSEFLVGVGEKFEVYGGVYGEIRTLKVNRRLRLSWQDVEWEKPSIVQITIVPRTKEKSVLVIQHEALKNSKLKTSLRDYWQGAIGNKRLEKIGLDARRVTLVFLKPKL